MDLKHLSDIHTGRYAQRIQHDIQRTAIWKEWHILYRKHTGNDTLVTMTSGHLVTNGNLSLLGNVDTHCLVHTWRKLVSVFSCKYFGVYNNTIFSVRYFQRSVSHFTGFLAKDRS